MDLSTSQERVEAAFPGRLFLTPSLTNPFLVFAQTRVGSSQEALGANFKDKNVRQAMGRADARAAAAAHLATTMLLSRTPSIPCSACGGTITLAIHEHRESRCGECGKTTTMSWWPSADALIQHFEMCDPLKRDQVRRIKALDAEKSFGDLHKDRMVANEAGAHVKDALIAQLPSFAYSGATKAWVDAPDSPKAKAKGKE